MKEIDGNFLLDEISKHLDRIECDYILALFPPGESSSTLASIGLNISDADHMALVLSQIIMSGDELGWSILELLQKVCKNLPLPLHQMLAASLADYRELTVLHEQEGGEILSKGSFVHIK